MRRLWHFYRTRKRRTQILIVVLLLMVSTASGLYAWVTYDLPSLDNIEAGLALPSTRIYDRHGRLLYEILPPEQGRNRVIPLEAIPEYCIQAVIATEDANYYSHPGVDIVGILRALWINIQGGEVLAGGSTITQQTARLLLLDPQQQAERTLHRKLREMVLALRLQNAYSKEHVLALYLNQVYFGNLAYGIEAAARTYFAKSAEGLSLAECSLLAGLVQNAAAYDPLSNLEAARER
ncbi:MAG: penicillin-binding protein, partial [Chloroflexi bacterium]